RGRAGGVRAREEALAAGLPRDGRNRRVGVSGRGVGCLHAARPRAAVGVGDEDAALSVYVNAVEVEEVSVRGRAAAEVYAVALDGVGGRCVCDLPSRAADPVQRNGDRKSTRLNSSHLGISYAVFCLKKKRK